MMKMGFNFDYYVSEFDFCTKNEKRRLENALMAAWIWGLKH